MKAPRLGSSAVSLEAELMLLLCGTAQRRSQFEPRVRQLATEVDYAAVVEELTRQRLLALAGRRLEQQCAEALPPSFTASVREAVAGVGRQDLLFRSLAGRALRTLEAVGITAVPLKGALMAQELYGEEPLRGARDIDLLVSRSALKPALAALSRDGYTPVEDEDGASLPELHYRLVHPQPWRPLIELHWRLHWYETAFSPAALERSRRSRDGGHRLLPGDELAALLLFFARDGFIGLRYASDIAAWWDRYGQGSGEPPLDPILDAHEELRDALLVAAAAAESLVGVPSRMLHSGHWEPRRRALLALRLVNWTASGSTGQAGSNRTLVEWVLGPPHQTGAFIRRRFVPPAMDVRRMYRLPQRAPIRLALRRATHGPKLLLRYALALGSTRAARPGSSLPNSLQRTRDKTSDPPAAASPRQSP